MMPDDSFGTLISQRIRESIAVKEKLLRDETCLVILGQVASIMTKALRSGDKLLFMGNGGSAADAQHLAAEFAGRYRKERRALPAMALSVNMSSLTAIANDYSFDTVFARQVEAMGRCGDVAIGLSTSGTSSNIVRGMETARRLGLVTVALTGESGGYLKDTVEYCMCVPSSETPRIQEAHILLGHILCEIVEDAITS